MNIEMHNGDRGLIAKGDKDSLRSLFHLFVGKPDSTQKVFPRPKLVNTSALLDLNDRIKEKLNTHHIDGLIASADLLFEDKTAIQFGGWAEFESFRWTSSKITKEIRMRWQFLLSVPNYELPQQHALTVKLCSDAKPIELLQAILSKHPAEDDVIDINFAPTICRVDFISHSIGQELISIVEDWNQSLPKPEAHCGIVIKLDKHKELITATIDYSTPILFAVSSIFILRMLYPSQTYSDVFTLGLAVQFVQWIVLGVILIYIADKISSWLARLTYHAIDKYGMYSMFRLTNGDENRCKKINQTNSRQIIKILLATFFSFLMNVAAGIVVAVYWPAQP